MDRWAARVLVVAATAVAAAVTGWGIADSASTTTYYAAAVRSMATSWHAFGYAAFDPAGAVSVDKMPGALWVQALSVRLFGYHSWALLLPQVLAAAGTVPLLYDAVRRWHSRRAGVVAAVTFALTPVTLALARTTVPDTVLVLCLVGAAHATTCAIHSGRWVAVSGAGAWWGAAFAVKGLQVAVVVPALMLAWLAAGRGVRRFAAAAALALAVALAWPLWVWLTPAERRPYVDGTVRNSIWEQIAVYNGFGRLTTLGVDVAGVTPVAVRFGGAPGPLRLFNTEIGAQLGWLLPLAVVALAVGLVVTRRARRQSPRRAGYLLWGGWLLTYAVALSVADGIHPYSAAPLAPAIAALVGAGAVTLVTAARMRHPLGWLLPVAVAGTGAWGAVLAARTPDFLPWLPGALVLTTTLATVTTVCLAWPGALPRALRLPAPALALAAVLLGPSAWAVTVPATAAANPEMGLNPVAGPGPPVIVGRPGADAAGQGTRVVTYLTAHRRGERFLFATANAEIAAPFVADGHPVLALGGFTGASPHPTVPRLASLVAGHDLRYILLPPNPTDPGPERDRTTWVRSHCQPVPPDAAGRDGLYDCAPGRP